MKWKAVIVSCLWSLSVIGQPQPVLTTSDLIVPIVPKPCELNCSCKVLPGQIDRCKRFWTFKQNPNGSPVAVVNSDPSACDMAVDDNIEALSKHFGNTPEFSLPTKDMTTKASSFTLPLQTTLPYSRQLDTTSSLVPSEPLDTQITAQILRVKALTDDMRSYAKVGIFVSQWQMAEKASKRLSAKVEGAEIALSMAKPWPKLPEFAAKVWDLAICTHNRPSEQDTLSSRIQNESDLAWNFAFMDDWITLLRAFDTGSEAQNMGSPSFESIARPFFVEPVTRVKERTEKSLFTLFELRSFRSAIVQSSVAISSYLQDLNVKTKLRLLELSNATDTELAAVSRIHEAFRAEMVLVANLKLAAETAVSEQVKVKTSIDIMDSNILTNTMALASKTEHREQLRQARAAKEADLAAKRSEVNNAQTKLQAIVLNCNGKLYDTCNDVAAKKAYDKLRYEANQVVAAARSAAGHAQAALVAVDRELLAVEIDIPELLGRIASMKKSLNELYVASNTLEKNLNELWSKLQVAEDWQLKLTDSISKLDASVESLVKFRPSLVAH